MSGPLERGKDWGCGVGYTCTCTCTDSWSQGDGEVHASLLFLYLSSSFLPSFFLLVPVELPHLVKYMSSTDLTVPAISYFLWLTGYISEVTGNMKFSWLLSFFLLTLSINQIIPTTNNPRFCMMITTNLPKPTHQKTLVCVIIFFPSPTCTVRYLT